MRISVAREVCDVHDRGACLSRLRYAGTQRGLSLGQHQAGVESRAMVAFASACAQAAIHALLGTLRCRVAGAVHRDSARQSGRPLLFTVWHGRLLYPLYAHRGQQIVAMVSLSRDGDLAAAVLERFGYGVVRGSSSRGGREAYDALRGHIGAGRDGAIIPDGPRGPARALKPGLLRLAQETGAVILPLSWSARPARRLRSWDHHLVPAPFARAVLVYGEPLAVARTTPAAEVARAQELLTARLDELERAADQLAGRVTAATVPDGHAEGADGN